MDARHLTIWGRRLYSRLPLVGGWLRLRAVDRLARDDSPEAVGLLAEAVARSDDPRVCVAALEALQEVERPRCVEAVCAVWAQTRNVYLEELLTIRGWAAQAAAPVRVLYQLGKRRLDEVAAGGPEVVEPLLALGTDADPEVARRARAVLGRLESAEAREALCRRVLEEDDGPAGELAAAAGYAPRAAGQRALFFFLTGQWEAYEALDFDRRLLRAVYQAADARLRRRIADRARAAGRVEWVEVVTGGRQALRLAEMTDAEWQATLDVLVGRRQWGELWRLAQEAPPRWGARLLQRLESLDGLTPERAGLEELARLARAWREPSLAALLRERPLCGEEVTRAESLAISPDGQLLAVGDREGVIRLWSLPDGQLLRRLEGPGPVSHLAMSPRGRVLIGADDQGGVRFWSLPDGGPCPVLPRPAHGAPVTCLEVIPKGKAAISAGLDGSIALWDLASHRPRQILKYDGWPVTCLAASPDGRTLVSGGTNGALVFWDLAEGRVRHARHGHGSPPLCLAVCPAGDLLASGSQKGDIRLWSLPAGEPGLTLTGHTGSVDTLAVSPCGRFLASGGQDTTVRLWGLPNGQLRHTLAGHIEPVRSLQFSPDGQILASGSNDDTVELWGLPDGRPLKTLCGSKGATARLAISPDGLVLAAAGPSGAQVWSAELARLCHLPGAQLKPQDLAWLEDAAAAGALGPGERPALEFVIALARWRRRYDIHLDDAPRHVAVGEFDIIISG